MSRLYQSIQRNPSLRLLHSDLTNPVVQLVLKLPENPSLPTIPWLLVSQVHQLVLMHQMLLLLRYHRLTLYLRLHLEVPLDP